MAGLDLGYPEMADRGIGVGLERCRPLCPVFPAPACRMFVDIGFGAFLEARQQRPRLLGPDICSGGLAFLHDIDTGRAAIALDAQPGSITCKPRFLQGYILKRTKPQPMLLATDH